MNVTRLLGAVLCAAMLSACGEMVPKDETPTPEKKQGELMTSDGFYLGSAKILSVGTYQSNGVTWSVKVKMGQSWDAFRANWYDTVDYNNYSQVIVNENYVSLGCTGNAPMQRLTSPSLLYNTSLRSCKMSIHRAGSPVWNFLDWPASISIAGLQYFPADSVYPRGLWVMSINVPPGLIGPDIPSSPLTVVLVPQEFP